MIGEGGDEVSTMSVVYPLGEVSVSSLDYFSFLGSSSNPSCNSISIYLRACHTKEYFNKKRERKRKFIKPQEERARHEERRNHMRVTVSEKLVVVFGELITIDSGYDNSAEHDIDTVTK